MENYKLLRSRRQPVNLKKILTKAEFSSSPAMVRKCGGSQCECCNYLLLSDSYLFKQIGVQIQAQGSNVL